MSRKVCSFSLFPDFVPNESLHIDSGHSALQGINGLGDEIILIAVSVDTGSFASHCYISVV